MFKKRKMISPKVKLQIFKRDNYTCKLCGRTPALNSGLTLDVDHVFPHSKGGGNEVENLQTLCANCNRSKGNNESLNKTIQNEIDALLNDINPEISEELKKTESVCIVANDADFTKLMQLNNSCHYLKIEVIPNTIIGYHAGYNMGIYAVNDNCAQKVNFSISKVLD